MATGYHERARRLRNAVEPVAAGVYFAPEAHAAYGKLGFDASQVVGRDGISRPEMKSYFTSQGAPMGDMWRAADLVREHRGDSHVISWAVGGVDAVEILLLTEQLHPQRIAGVYNVGGGPQVGSGLTIDTAVAQYGGKA